MTDDGEDDGDAVPWNYMPAVDEAFAAIATAEEKRADRRAAFKEWQSVPASHRKDEPELIARMKGMSREEFSALCVEFGIREGARDGCGA